MWYNVCNDYSLDSCEEPEFQDLWETEEVDEGMVILDEYGEPIYLLGEAGLTNLDYFC